MRTNEEFGEQFRECLKKAAFDTNKELAEKLYVDPALISHWKAGRRIPPEPLLNRIIDVFRKCYVPRELTDKLRELAGYHSREVPEYLDDPTVRQIAHELAALTSLKQRETLANAITFLSSKWRQYFDGLALFEKGEKEQRKDYWKAAEKHFSKVLKREEELPASLRVRTLYQLAQIHYREGKLELAETMLKRAAWEAKEANRMRVEILMRSGSLYRRLGKWDRARQLYEESAKSAREIGEATLEAENIRKIAGVYLFEVKPDEAVFECAVALTKFRSLGKKREVAKALQHQAWAKAFLGKREEAIADHLEGLRIWEDLDIPYEKAKGYRYLGDTYRMFGDHKEAERRYRMARELCESGRVPAESLIIGPILHGLGSVYLEKPERWPEAEKYLQASLIAHSELGDQYQVGRTNIQLARLSANRGKHRAAKELFLVAEERFRDLQIDYYRLAALINLCATCYEQGAADEVYHYAQKAKEVLSQNPEAIVYLKPLAVLYSILADTKIADLCYPEGFELYCQATNTARRFHNSLGEEIFGKLVQRIDAMCREGSAERALDFCDFLIKSWEQDVEGRENPQVQRWLERIRKKETEIKTTWFQVDLRFSPKAT